jgi:hypothetical protein
MFLRAMLSAAPDTDHDTLLADAASDGVYDAAVFGLFGFTNISNAGAVLAAREIPWSGTRSSTRERSSIRTSATCSPHSGPTLRRRCRKLRKRNSATGRDLYPIST